MGCRHAFNRDGKRVGVISGQSADALAPPLKKSTEPRDRGVRLGNAQTAAKPWDGLFTALVGNGHAYNRDDKRDGEVSGESADALAPPLKSLTGPHDRDVRLEITQSAAK